MLIRLLLCLMLLPTLAHATVDWDEGFEYSGATVQQMYNSMVLGGGGPWDSSCGNNPGDNSVVIAPTTQALGGPNAPAPHSGSKMLRETFRGHQGITPGYQSCYIDRVLNAPTTGTLYTRYWIFIPTNFQVDATVTKMTLHPTYASDSYTSVWWDMMWGSPLIGANVQKVWSPPALGDSTEIIYGATIPKGQWACVETRITYATPGTNNGIVQSWLNGTQHINRTNVWMDQTGQQSVFRSVRLYTQDGVGDVFYDDYAVSRDARITCGSAPPPDTTPPPPVSGTPVIGSTVPGQVTLSWTAITGVADLAGYDVGKCVGAACTTLSVAGSPSTNTLTLSGETEGSVVGLAVRSRDTSGNVSTYTSIVYVTVASTPSGGGGAKTLSISANGLWILNGTQVMLQGATYFDAMNWRTSDIDQLAAYGFNYIRTFANYAEDTYGGARAVCTSTGALNSTRQATLQALIDYAESKNIVTQVIIMSDLTNYNIPVDANKQTCVTNIVNAYKTEPLVIFDINNEHMEVANTWINSTTKYATYHNIAKAACSTCRFTASSTSPFAFPQDNTANIVTSYYDGMLAAGIDYSANHDYRGSNWYSVSGARTTAIRNYFISKGRANMPVMFTEPCRWNYVADCNVSASAYFQAAVGHKSAGGAGWLFHHGYFDFSTQSLFQQLNATESQIMSGLAAALVTPTNTVPSILDTYGFTGTLSDYMQGGIATADTPVISGGRLRANATGTESVAVYSGLQTALTSLFTCTTANAGPPPSASWTTMYGNGLKVISNQCGQNTASTLNVNDAAAWGTSFGASQVVQATLAALPTISVLDYAMLFTNAQASSGAYDNMYELEIDRSGGTWRKRLYVISSGSYTQLGATDTTTVSAGAVFKIERVGTAISVYQDGTLIISAVDSTFTGGGYLGIVSYRDTVATTTRWTNISGGTYVASTTIPANHGITSDVPTATGSNPMYIRLGVRMQSGSAYSGYDCRVNFNPDQALIVRKDNNNPTTLAGPVTWTRASGIPGCFANGSTIYMTQGSVTSTPILSTTDSTYSTGKPYVYLNTAGEPLANLELDNLTIYEFVTAAPACTPSISAVVASATGATVTYDAACPPTQIKVDTELNTETRTLSAFPSGVYTRTGGWKIGENFTCMYAVDAQGVVNTTTYGCDGVSEFVPNPDVTAPVMTLAAPLADLPNGTTSTQASLTTDESAECRWATTNIAFTAMTNIANAVGLNQNFTATGLTTGTTNFYVQCRDFATPTPNATSTALLIPITVAASTADTTPPTTVASMVATAISPTQISITHPLSTDAGGDPTYQAWISQDGSAYSKALDYTGVPAVIPGLQPNTLYYVKVLAIDLSLNPASAYSNVQQVTTPQIPDTTPPPDPSGLTVDAVYSNSVVIHWDHQVDNRGAVQTSIELCSGSASCTAFSLVKTASGDSATVTGLTANTIYRVRIKHTDDAGNVSVNYSSRVNFTTLAAVSLGLIQPRAPVAFEYPRLQRN